MVGGDYREEELLSTCQERSSAPPRGSEEKKKKKDELGFGGRLATIHLYADHYPPVAFLEEKKIGADYRLKMLLEKEGKQEISSVCKICS